VNTRNERAQTLNDLIAALTHLEGANSDEWTRFQSRELVAEKRDTFQQFAIDHADKLPNEIHALWLQLFQLLRHDAN
jgi:hypothetical protein